ncbi:MAG: F0F1 ATP synthase subunit delta [Verrucomicrobia bacterium]|nr:F0F1 ATP synthase subunit delta [Verrucomicrobiota bacterium]MBM3871560.1 F0F1 ATP synthase subunit delta [Verrucomicrobiota bacterium]
MKVGKQSRRDAKVLFAACCVGGLLDEAKIRQAVAAVIAQKPRGYVGTLTHLQRLVKLDLDRRSARVENAVETTPAQREAVQTALAAKYGPGMNVTFAVNPALIGGLKIKAGSDIYDGSVAGRLAALNDTL